MARLAETRLYQYGHLKALPHVAGAERGGRSPSCPNVFKSA